MQRGCLFSRFSVNRPGTVRYCLQLLPRATYCLYNASICVLLDLYRPKILPTKLPSRPSEGSLFCRRTGGVQCLTSPLPAAPGPTGAPTAHLSDGRKTGGVQVLSAGCWCAPAAESTDWWHTSSGKLRAFTEEEVFEGGERHREDDGEAPPREHTVRHIVITLQ